jgi:histone arginine demethylase JMJD6
MWHAVLNLENTIAVTQNFVSSVNLEESWPTFMEERGELVLKML